MGARRPVQELSDAAQPRTAGAAILTAVRTGGRWVVLEPVDDVRSADPGVPADAGIPARFVVLTAGGGPHALDLLRARVSALEPNERPPLVLDAAEGAGDGADHPDSWSDRRYGVAVDISRDEAAMITAEIGGTSFRSVEGAWRLLLGTGDDGIVTTERYRIHVTAD